jgi:T4 RnlA family RNA ligase
MKVQEWLRNNGGNLELLEQQLGIKSTCHEDGRVILNYSQIDSPKQHPIVIECRGLVLDSNNNWGLVARAFNRFFNVGEFVEDFKLFDFNNCLGYHKEDGSLLLVYYWNGEWRFNTRGSFGEGEVNYSGITWKELALKALPQKFLDRASSIPGLTYVFELCSPHNKIVRTYKEPQVFLLAVFNNKGYEYPYAIVSGEAEEYGLQMPYVSPFFSIEDVEGYIALKAQDDPTFEGIVLRDRRDRRWKVKSTFYIELHRTLNNGNVLDTANLSKLILQGEVDEIIAYFPEFEDRINELKHKIECIMINLDNYWYCFKDLISQKKFALQVKDLKYSWVLFQARKLDSNPRSIILDNLEKFCDQLKKNGV